MINDYPNDILTVNWSFKIICPEAINYWKFWSIERGGTFFPRKELNWQILSIKFINNWDESTIFYEKKDLILAFYCLELIHDCFYDSKFYINEKEMDVDERIEFFEALSKNKQS